MKSATDAVKTGASRFSSTTIMSVAAGAAVGLAAGILLAPAKGKDTRAKLMGGAKDFAGELKNKAADVAPGVVGGYTTG